MIPYYQSKIPYQEITMNKILLLTFPLLLTACTAYDVNHYIPYGVNTAPPAPRPVYVNGHYQQPRQQGYQQPHNTYYAQPQYNESHHNHEYNEHHDNGKHKGQHKNKHHDDD
jgi:hypothetical protein